MSYGPAVVSALLWAALPGFVSGQSESDEATGRRVAPPLSGATSVDSVRSPVPTASAYLVVSSRTDNKGLVQGSTRGVAFAVERDGAECILVTADHVIHGATEVNVYRLNDDMSAGAGYEARVRWRNESRDVAALTIRNRSDCTPVKHAVEPPQLGHPIYAFLNAPLQRGMVTVGTLGAIWPTELGPMIVGDMRVHPGQSGSPLFDGKGRLLGMVVSRSQSGEVSVAFALPNTSIQAELAANRAPTSPHATAQDGDHKPASSP